MKHLFIVNPTAGGKDSTSEVRAKVEEAFSTREGQYEIYVTRGGTRPNSLKNTAKGSNA